VKLHAPEICLEGGPHLSQAPTLQYDKVIFILAPSEPVKAAIGKRATVIDYPDGRLVLRRFGTRASSWLTTPYKMHQVDQGA
jgi:hypothetical protein